MTKEEFTDKVEKDFTDYLDAVTAHVSGRPDSGFRDEDLPALLQPLRRHAEALWERHGPTWEQQRTNPILNWEVELYVHRHAPPV